MNNEANSSSHNSSPPEKFKVLGTRPPRKDGVDKLTGRAVFGSDIRLPGLLHGKMLRSPHAHAHIRSIDTGESENLPGVHAVVTAKDLPRAVDKTGVPDETATRTKSPRTAAISPW